MTNVEKTYTLEELMAMNKIERREKIKHANITKAVFCNTLLKNPKFKKIPGKAFIIKKIGSMSELDFQQVIIKTLDQI